MLSWNGENIWHFVETHLSKCMSIGNHWLINKINKYYIVDYISCAAPNQRQIQRHEYDILASLSAQTHTHIHTYTKPFIMCCTNNMSLGNNLYTKSFRPIKSQLWNGIANEHTEAAKMNKKLSQPIDSRKVFFFSFCSQSDIMAEHARTTKSQHNTLQAIWTTQKQDCGWLSVERKNRCEKKIKWSKCRDVRMMIRMAFTTLHPKNQRKEAKENG